MGKANVDKVLLVNSMLAGWQILASAVQSESARELFNAEDLAELKAAVQKIQAMQVRIG